MKKYGRGTDTVPAMLSPHEAVLNRRAADLLGRGKIRKLNAMGNAISRGRRKYQGGTEDVQPNQVYKTVSIEIDGKTHEVPAIVPGMTPAEQVEVITKPPAAWSDSVHEKIGDHAENMLRQGLTPMAGPEIYQPFQPRDYMAPPPTALQQAIARSESVIRARQVAPSEYAQDQPQVPTMTPLQMDAQYRARQAANEVLRQKAMNEKPKGYQSGTSDVKDLLRDIDNKVDEGGSAPPPTPTPTPTPRRKYQYGTANVAPYNQNQPAINYTSGAPTGGAGLNVASNSTGFSSPFGAPVPYLPAGQNVPSGLNIGNLIYSASAGGYLTRAEAENANSWYNKFGAGSGGDPMANRQASAFYSWVGNLPTRAAGTPALNQLYSMTGYTQQPGPSYNSILGNIFNNASPQNQNQFRQAGFGPTYTGPYAFGQRTNHGISGTGSPMSGTAW